MTGLLSCRMYSTPMFVIILFSSHPLQFAPLKLKIELYFILLPYLLLPSGNGIFVRAWHLRSPALWFPHRWKCMARLFSRVDGSVVG